MDADGRWVGLMGARLWVFSRIAQRVVCHDQKAGIVMGAGAMTITMDRGFNSMKLPLSSL